MQAPSPIALGTDESVLHLPNLASNHDPSGFSGCGFDQQATKKILDLAQNAWNTVQESLPRDFSIPLPKTIPLYMEKVQKDQMYPGAVTLVRSDRSIANIRKQNSDDGYRINVIRYPLSTIRGISLALTPEMFNAYENDVYEIFVHEMLHVLSYNALASSIAFVEAFAERLTHGIVQKRDSRALKHLSWNSDNFSSTCGLRIGDFAEYSRVPAFRNLLNIHALIAFRDISCDEMWRIIGNLLIIANNSGFCPTFLEILSDTKSVVGNDRLENVLQSTLVKPLREGKQFFFCPFGQELLAFCFEVKRNNRYLCAPLTEPLAWDKFQFFITESVTSVTIIATFEDQKKLSIEHSLSGQQSISWKGLVSMLQESSDRPFSEEDILSIRCEALGAFAIIKKPSEQRVQKAAFET